MRLPACWIGLVFALAAVTVAGTGGTPFAADSEAPAAEPELGRIVTRTLLHAPDGTPDTRTTIGIGEPVEFRLVPRIDKSGRPVIPRLEDDALGLITWCVDGKGSRGSPLWNITGDVTVVEMWGPVSVGVEAHGAPAKAAVAEK